MTPILDSIITRLDQSPFPMTKGNPTNYTDPRKLVDEYLAREGFNSWSYCRHVNKSLPLARRILVLPR